MQDDTIKASTQRYTAIACRWCAQRRVAYAIPYPALPTPHPTSLSLCSTLAAYRSALPVHWIALPVPYRRWAALPMKRFASDVCCSACGSQWTAVVTRHGARPMLNILYYT